MSSAERLAREILDTRRLALGHATSPQLTSSAIDGGGIDFRDAEGNPIGGIGVGDDGGFVIDYSGGPKPPKPSPPTVTADAGIFRVEWDGSFVNEGDEGVLATSDTDRVEIHASMDENFVPDRVESFGGAFATLDGGSFTLGPLPEAGTYYFRLVARSRSAQFSEPSDRVEQALAITSLDLEVIDAWLTGEAAQTTADGKNSIWRGPDEPAADPDHPFKDGDIWFEMTEDGKSIPNIWDETAGAWVGNDDKRQSDIERVQQELRDELNSVIVDGGGTANFYQPTPPSSSSDPAPKEGDLWFDSSEDGKNMPHIYRNGQWVSVADQRQTDVVDAIAAAKAEAIAAAQDFDAALSGQIDDTIDQARQDLSGDITAAQARADAAFQNAATADSNATAAKNAADQAADDAAAAAGIASGKGKVVYGTTAPGAADRNVNTLWIDTTDGANTPKRWTSGATWVAVTDKAAVDAAAKAASAQSDAAAARSAADQALESADQAQSMANAAQAAATQALTSANSKNRITRSTSNPPSSYDGRVDDVWWVLSSMGSGGRVLSQWRWSGAVWVSELVGSEVIAYLDAAKITVGEMDGARIKAGTLYADRIVSGLSQNMVPDPGFANDEINSARLGRTSAFGSTWTIGNGTAVCSAPSGVTATPEMPLIANADLWGWAAYPAMKVVARINARVTGGQSSFRFTIRIKKRDGSTQYSGMTPNAFQPITSQWSNITAEYSLPQEAVGFSVVMQCGSDTVGTVELRSPFVASSVSGTVIENGAITTDKVAANAINAGKIAAGAIEAGHIKAGAITIGTVTDLQSNLDSKETPAGAQSKADAAKTAAQQAAAADAQNKANAAKAAAEAAAKTYADAVSSGASADAIAAAKADATAKADAARAAAISAAATAADAVYGETKSLVSGWRVTGQTTIAGGKIATDSITAAQLAAGTITAESGVIGSIDAGTITVGEMNGARIKAGTINAGLALIESSIGSTLIKDGAITTNKIAVGAITAESGIIGSIDANVITSGKIMGNQIDADAMNGKTITGATIRTASAGARVELTQNGLKQYNSLGATIVDMTAGSFTLQGGSITGSTIKTATSGSRVEITTQGLRQFNSSDEAIVTMANGGVEIVGGLQTTSGDYFARVGMVNTTTPGFWFNRPAGSYSAGMFLTGTQSAPGLWLQGGSSVGDGGGMSGATLKLYSPSAASVLELTGAGSTGKGSGIRVNKDTYSSTVVGGLDGPTYQHPATMTFSHDSTGQRIWSAAIFDRKYGAGSPLVRVTSAGTLGADSSARRFKFDEQELGVDEYARRLLSVPYKSWISREEQRLYEEYIEFRETFPMSPVPEQLGEAPQEPPLRDVGLVAEDLADAGLEEFVQRDSFGQTQGVSYDRIAAALIPIVRSQQDRIEALEARLATN